MYELSSPKTIIKDHIPLCLHYGIKFYVDNHSLIKPKKCVMENLSYWRGHNLFCWTAVSSETCLTLCSAFCGYFPRPCHIYANPPCCIVLYCSVLCYIVLYCSVLCYIVLCFPKCKSNPEMQGQISWWKRDYIFQCSHHNVVFTDNM